MGYAPAIHFVSYKDAPTGGKESRLLSRTTDMINQAGAVTPFSPYAATTVYSDNVKSSICGSGNDALLLLQKSLIQMVQIASLPANSVEEADRKMGDIHLKAVKNVYNFYSV